MASASAAAMQAAADAVWSARMATAAATLAARALAARSTSSSLSKMASGRGVGGVTRQKPGAYEKQIQMQMQMHTYEPRSNEECDGAEYDGGSTKLQLRRRREVTKLRRRIFTTGRAAHTAVDDETTQTDACVRAGSFNFNNTIAAHLDDNSHYKNRRYSRKLRGQDTTELVQRMADAGASLAAAIEAMRAEREGRTGL